MKRREICGSPIPEEWVICPCCGAKVQKNVLSDNGALYLKKEENLKTDEKKFISEKNKKQA